MSTLDSPLSGPLGQIVSGVMTAPGSSSVSLVGPSRIAPQFGISRSTTATYLDTTGVLQSVAANTPRFVGPGARLLVEEGRANSIRNPRGEAAVVGGAFPTNWGFGTVSSLTPSVVGMGTESGLAYVDIRFTGTTTNTTAAIPLTRTASSPQPKGRPGRTRFS